MTRRLCEATYVSMHDGKTFIYSCDLPLGHKGMHKSEDYDADSEAFLTHRKRQTMSNFTKEQWQAFATRISQDDEASPLAGRSLSAPPAPSTSTGRQIRDAALAEYREVQSDPSGIYGGMDPGDAPLCLKGNDHPVGRILSFLALIGVPGCEPKAAR